jgi:predicted metal-binding membrane protein
MSANGYADALNARTFREYRGEENMKLTSMVIATVAMMVATSAFAQSPRIVMEEMMVPSSDAGIQIYVRNKRRADMTSFRPERTVLFVHGSALPAHTSFDLQLDGMSWLDYMAARRYDVWLLDVRDYGKSTRPPEMSEKPAANDPTTPFSLPQ